MPLSKLIVCFPKIVKAPYATVKNLYKVIIFLGIVVEVFSCTDADQALLCDTKAAGTSTAGTLQRQSRMREVMKYISPEYWDEIDALIRELDLEFVGVTRIYNEDKSPKNEYDERKK